MPAWKGGNGEGEVLKQALAVKNCKPLSSSGRELLLYSDFVYALLIITVDYKMLPTALLFT